MASGRDIHSPEYHSKSMQEFRKRKEYLHAKQGTTPALAGVGLLPSHTPACHLAHNWIDIESTLLGIGSNDCIQPKRRLPTLPDYKKVPILNIVEPSPLILLSSEPKPLPNQRMRYYLGGQTIQPRYEKQKQTDYSKFKMFW